MSRRTGSRADDTVEVSTVYASRLERDNSLDSDASLLDNLVRESSGEADNGALGRGVIEQLKRQ